MQKSTERFLPGPVHRYGRAIRLTSRHARANMRAPRTERVLVSVADSLLSQIATGDGIWLHALNTTNARTKQAQDMDPEWAGSQAPLSRTETTGEPRNKRCRLRKQSR